MARSSLLILPLCLAALFAVGCGGANLPALKDPGDFYARVLKADRPVLVQFNKWGCPMCALQAPVLEKLDQEYAGRVAMYKFERHVSAQIRDEHNVTEYPTVMIFHHGKLVRKWTLHFTGRDFRQVLDAQLAATPTTAPAAPPPAPPATQSP